MIAQTWLIRSYDRSLMRCKSSKSSKKETESVVEEGRTADAHDAVVTLVGAKARARV